MSEFNQSGNKWDNLLEALFDQTVFLLYFKVTTISFIQS